MELYFLRHGLAGQHGDPRYKDDSLRPLTTKGKEKMRSEALGMKSLGLKFDAVLSSPYLRAKQTAEIVAKVYKNKKVFFTKNLLSPTSIYALLQEIEDNFPKSQSALLVGHEPHLSQMVSELLECTRPLNIDFKKGGLCCISCEGYTKGAPATLNWLLQPDQLIIAQQ